MYFVVDPDREVDPQRAAFVWQRLWEIRDLVPISALTTAVVASPCPLLPSEAADATHVATLTQVPAGTAWASIEVDLLRHARPDGSLRMALLDASLRDAVEEGERCHLETRWPGAEQREDSRINRRLSVFVRGWGDIVRKRGIDPGDIAALRELEALVDRVGNTLEQASGFRRRESPFRPRLLHHGEEMQSRWRRAIVDKGLRHRNLLTLSPWDVFPRGEPADFACMNLLPLIRKAHSVSLRREADISCWDARDFRAFHQRVSAILRAASETPLVAQQV